MEAHLVHGSRHGLTGVLPCGDFIDMAVWEREEGQGQNKGQSSDLRARFISQRMLSLPAVFAARATTPPPVQLNMDGCFG